MASWCWICHRKVDVNYVYYKGGKCHKSCRNNEVKKEPKKDNKK